MREGFLDLDLLFKAASLFGVATFIADQTVRSSSIKEELEDREHLTLKWGPRDPFSDLTPIAFRSFCLEDEDYNLITTGPYSDHILPKLS